MRDIQDRFKVLQDSTNTALGGYLLDCESDLMSRLLLEYRGKKVLVLAGLNGLNIQPSSAFQVLYSLCPDSDTSSETTSLLSRFDNLPFDSSEFDIVLLQHVLEYSSNPQQVLKEAARVTNHGGHMFIIGFNPISSHGLCSLILGRLKPDSFWRRKSLLMYRVKDWLKFLDFNHIKSSNLGHCLPVSNVRYLSLTSKFNQLLTKLNAPFSPSYCIVSRKDVPGMTSSRLDWKEVVLTSAMPVRRAAPTASGFSKVTHINNHKSH